jgi:putative flippase GtrA
MVGGYIVPSLSLSLRLRDPTTREFIRFVAVGTASAGLYFGLQKLFRMETTMSVSACSTLAYGLGIGPNYAVQKAFTFRSRRQHAQAGPRYIVVQGSGLVINSLVLWLGVDRAHWPFWPVQMAAVALVTIVSYVGQKLWAFYRAH